MISLILNTVKDSELRKVFESLVGKINAQDVIKADLRVQTVEIKKAETGLKIKHNLSYTPLDIWVSSKKGAGSVTIVYDKTDATNIVIDTTGAATIRLVYGRFEG